MLTDLLYLVAVSFIIVGLHQLRTPRTARRGNGLAAGGMLIAVAVTLFDQAILRYDLIIAGMLLGGLVGAMAARFVQMTAMPQMVGLFNGFGGAASALVAVGEYTRLALSPNLLMFDTTALIALGVLIGGVTFTGSLTAFAKLQGLIPGRPVTFPLQRPLNGLLGIAFVVACVLFLADSNQLPVFLILLMLSLLLGLVTVLPIGAADMPVVISFLNACSGLAASMTGFVVHNQLLIIAGALVGASGIILTQMMCRSMNRSLPHVLFGAFGTDERGGVRGAAAQADQSFRSIDAEEAAMMLTYAHQVVIVPGYGMAVAQAQHAVHELVELLKRHGVVVKYAIHPVAGRMPGHMNVLLAEANVPYTELYDMDDINPEFEHTDVALVIGANDIVNPAARSDTDSPLYGMPILDVDLSHHIVVIKRSLNPGFAGVDNDLFYNKKTMMLFGDARDVMTGLVNEVKVL
jgi:NAD(P) transhydrogenase subunit beta